MIKKEFKIHEKALTKWGFFGWDVEDQKVVTKRDAEIVHNQDELRTLVFPHYIATPLVVNVCCDNEIEHIMPYNDVEMVFIVEYGRVIEVITENIREKLIERFGEDDGKLLASLVTKDARVIKQLPLEEILNTAEIDLIKDELFIETRIFRKWGRNISLDWHVHISYQEFVEEMKNHYRIIMENDDFIFLETPKQLVVPKEEFIKNNGVMYRYLDRYIELDDPAEYTTEYIYTISRFYKKYGVGAKCLMSDRNPIGALGFGRRRDTKEIVWAWKGTNIYDYEGIEIRTFPHEIIPMNSIRLNRNGNRIIRVFTIDKNAPTVIYKMDPRLEIIAVINPDGSIENITDSVPPVVQDIADNIETFVNQEFKYVDMNVIEMIYRINHIHDAWIIDANVIEPIGKTGCGKIVEAERLNIKEYLKKKFNVIYENEYAVVILRSDNTIRAVIDPYYAQRLTRKNLQIQSLEYEEKINPVVPLNQLMRNAIKNAKRKAIRKAIKDAYTNVGIDEVINYLRNIPSLKFTFRDSIAAGNCEYGTKRFIREEKLQEKEYLTLEEMLKYMQKNQWHDNILKIIIYKYLQRISPRKPRGLVSG